MTPVGYGGLDMTGFTFGMILTAVSFLLYAVSGIIELTIPRHDYS